MSHYHQITAAPGALSKPFIVEYVKGVHKMACCDCGLVHNFRFSAWIKVHNRGRLVGYRKLSRKSVVVMVEAGRNERATASRRRAARLRKVAAAINENGGEP